MSTIHQYFSVASEDTATLIGTTRGPNNTLILTYSNQIAIFPQINGQVESYRQPAQVYNINQTPIIEQVYEKSTKSSKKSKEAPVPIIQQKQYPKINAFTCPVFYHEPTEQLMVIGDNRYLLTWPTLPRATCYDGVTIEIFPSSSQFTILNIFENPTNPQSILVVDTWARLHNIRIPQVKELQLDGRKHLIRFNDNNDMISSKLSLKKKNKGYDNQCAPIIHWCGPITKDEFIIATETGIICYDMKTCLIIDEIYLNHALITSSHSQTQSNHLPVHITNISSYMYSPQNQQPRFFSISIPQVVLYQDGHLEIYSFNIPMRQFELLYSRTLSDVYTYQFSLVQVLTPQHIAIITPPTPISTSFTSSATVTNDLLTTTSTSTTTTSTTKDNTTTVDPKIASSTKMIIIDLTYYTINAVKVFSKQLPIITRTSAQNQIIYPNSFQLDNNNKTTLCVTILIADNKLQFLFSTPRLPTLSDSIGSATRDAIYWKNVPLVSTKSSFLATTASNQSTSNTDESIQQQNDSTTSTTSTTTTKTRVNKNDPRSILFLPNSKLSLTHCTITPLSTISLQPPTIAYPFSTQLLTNNKQPFSTQQPLLLTSDSKDAILTLATKTLPLLNPFSTTTSTPSFSNQLNHIEPPTTLLMQTATETTTTLDSVILSNWSTYLLQCDTIERDALKRMLPRLNPYLTTTPTPQQQRHKRNRGQDVYDINNNTIPTTNQQSKNVAIANDAGVILPDLAPEVFLYEFFAFTASWSDSTPALKSTLPSSLQSLYKGCDICSCKVSSTTPATYEKMNTKGVQQKQQHQPLPPPPTLPTAKAVQTTTSTTTTTTTTKAKKGSTKTPATKSTSKSQPIKPESDNTTTTTTTPPTTTTTSTHPSPSTSSLQQFVSSLVFEPCAWKSLLASIVSLTGAKVSSHILHSIALYNNYFAQANHHAVQKVLSTPHPFYCPSAPKLQIAKPLSPLFTHLLFRECLRKIESICCHNCPNILYLLPLQILISNCMLSSSLAVTCARVALKHKLWGLITSIIPAANISHSTTFIEIITNVLDDLADRLDNEVPTVLAIADINEDEGITNDANNTMNDDDEVTTTTTTTKATSKRTTKSQSQQQPSKVTIEQIDGEEDNDENQIITFTIQTGGTKQSQTRTDDLIRKNDLSSFCNTSKCTCGISPLFSTMQEPTNFNKTYPHLSQFICATLPQCSSACALYTLLLAPITKPILIEQLCQLSLDNVLTLLNVLSIVFQSKLNHTPLPSWLDCFECTQELTMESLLTWVTMLIDSHVKELLMAPHLLQKDQYHALDVFASLHSLITAYSTQNPQLLESTAGMTHQLAHLRELGITKLSVIEPYTIQVIKF